MILTLGFDFFLEKTYYLDELTSLKDNQVISQSYDLGGNSINAIRILKDLNLDVFITGFLGGLNGRFIFNELKKLEIYNDFIEIKDESPTNISVFKNDRFIYKLKEKEPRITREELESFYQLYEDIAYKYKFICALGEIPQAMPEDIYFKLIKIAKKNGRRLILDSKGPALEMALEASPYIVKARLEDLESLIKLKINHEGEIVSLARNYIENGAEVFIVDLDEKGSIVLTKESTYRLDINYNLYRLQEDRGFFIAGFVFGLSKNYDMETTMKLGQAMRIGYGNGKSINNIDMSDIKRIMGDIEIRKINY